MLRYLSPDITCSEKGTVFWEHSLMKILDFKGQIMYKDKICPSNIHSQAYFCPKWRLLRLLSFKYFAQQWRISPVKPPGLAFSHVKHSFLPFSCWNYWSINQCVSKFSCLFSSLCHVFKPFQGRWAGSPNLVLQNFLNEQNGCLKTLKGIKKTQSPTTDMDGQIWR